MSRVPHDVGLAPHMSNTGTVLVIDAAAGNGTVAVARGRSVLAACEVVMRASDDERLMPAVAAALAEAGVVPRTLAAVACGAGPGSFTSLRIAGAIAKGIAQVAACPLVAVPSLVLRAVAARRPGLRLVATDAMRGDRYAALVEIAGSGADAIATRYRYLGVHPAEAIPGLARTHGAEWDDREPDVPAPARGAVGVALALGGAIVGPRSALAFAPIDLMSWEPEYGRKAEAQVRWEVAHGRALDITVATVEVATPADPIAARP